MDEEATADRDAEQEDAEWLDKLEAEAEKEDEPDPNEPGEVDESLYDAAKERGEIK